MSFWFGAGTFRDVVHRRRDLCSGFGFIALNVILCIGFMSTRSMYNVDL